MRALCLKGEMAGFSSLDNVSKHEARSQPFCKHAQKSKFDLAFQNPHSIHML